MKIKASIFRGYDIRGLVGTDLSEDVMYVLGKAYATFLYKRRINECVVGRDIRLTSEAYEKSFVKGLLESGINVTDIGLTLSQILYFAQYHYLSKGGVMVTASHNPKEFNGLKLAVGFSDTLLGHEIQEVREIAEKGEFKKFDRAGTYEEDDVFPYYIDDLFKRIPTTNFKYKIVLDTLNATAGAFIPQILKRAGCEVIEQNTKLDGSFPLGTPDPTEKSVLERLSVGVKNNHADFGLAFDSDGDRLGVVDEDGSLIWNDILVAIFAEDVLEYLPGSPIIFNALCSKATEDTIMANNGKPIMWLTGHSFIKAKVKEERAPFGGELSGHFFFMDDFYGHDDTAYATLRLLSFLKRRNKSLKQVVDELPKYISSPEIKLGLADEIKFKFIDGVISKDIKAILPNSKEIIIDGFRADTKDEMVIIRASQNGPYITIKFEGKTQKQYDELKIKIREVLKKHKEIDWNSGVNTDAFD